MSPRASWLAWTLSSSRPSADVHDTGPRAASGAVQGIGPSSAQSTFTVALSHWKRRMSVEDARAARVSRGSSPR